MLSSFPLSKPVKNYRDIVVDITGTKKAHKENVIDAGSKFDLLKGYFALKACTGINNAFLKDKNVQKLISSGEQFDVVISMGKEALLGIGHVLNASTIRFNMLGMHSIYAAVTMNPLPSSYVPNFVATHSDKMTFFERVSNTIVHLFLDLYIHFFWIEKENEVMQKHIPGIPHLRDLQKKVHVTFVNSHIAMENARPYMSNVIPIGGFHIAEKEELPKKLKEFLDNSSEGVILFSMGTNLKAEHLKDKLNETLKCFRQLKMKVLWKHDGNIEGQPNNVMTFPWIPQQAVLAHPNLKLFITHGGLGSLLESVYFAIPMIILPIYLDQHKNAAQATKDGYALQMDVETLTADKLLRAIRDVTTNPAYANEIAVRSVAFRQQDLNPMERAVFWVERVASQRNPNYLKCVAKDMPLYQYYLLDVMGFVFFCGVIFLSVLILVVRKLCRFWKKDIKKKVKST